MHVIYLDDSRDEELVVFSALMVRANNWSAAFQEVRDFRRELKRDYGIYVYKELHAWEFVSGRGKISDQVVTKFDRSEIFKQALILMASLPSVEILNAVFPKGHITIAFERLLNRLNRSLQSHDSYGFLISDEGSEPAYTKLVRRMAVYNPIPSRFGVWPGSQTYKNIPLDRFVEDIFFKKSSQSYFLQLVDFVAYALLRRERPVPSKTKYGIDQAFLALEPILNMKANQRDPYGIIRP